MFISWAPISYFFKIFDYLPNKCLLLFCNCRIFCMIYLLSSLIGHMWIMWCSLSTNLRSSFSFRNVVWIINTFIVTNEFNSLFKRKGMVHNRRILLAIIRVLAQMEYKISVYRWSIKYQFISLYIIYLYWYGGYNILSTLRIYPNSCTHTHTIVILRLNIFIISTQSPILNL